MYLRRVADDRARVDANLLSDDVLPLRLSGDLDRVVRLERERRARVRPPRPAGGNRYTDTACRDIVVTRRRDAGRAGLSRPNTCRAGLLTGKSVPDAGDLRTFSAPVSDRRRRRVAVVRAIV